jgi:transcriptional regulator with XRE-family HTH domain
VNTGALVREARRRSGLTQRELAVRAGVVRNTVTQIERGTRTPSVGVLVRLLAAAGLQMRVELEPLDDDARREMRAVRDRAELAKDVLDVWGCLHAMDEVAYRIEGLAAAAWLGAPIAVPVVSIAFADTDATFAWLAEQIRSAVKVRLEGADWPIEFRLPRVDGSDDGALVRARLHEECPDGRFWFEAWFDTLSARIAPAEVVARHVVVATRLGPIAAQPLDEVESTDGDVARVLRVMRESSVTP